MMEEICCRTRAKIKNEFPKIETYFISAFFDDIGVGTQDEKEHLQVLETLFKICREHQIRIKLSKCDLLKQSLDYLGYHIEENFWTPSPTKIAAILKAKISTSKTSVHFWAPQTFTDGTFPILPFHRHH